jgi:acetoacetyl-CoA synthetase
VVSRGAGSTSRRTCCAGATDASDRVLGRRPHQRRLSHRKLSRPRLAHGQALADAGVEKGDRVAGYLPNLPESDRGDARHREPGRDLVELLAGLRRAGRGRPLRQIEPKVLFCADGYLYGGKQYETQDKVKEILAKLPSVKACVVLPYVGISPSAGVSLEKFIEPYKAKDIAFEQVEFNHPLYILYSSGTTGVPKCIVHGTGGTLLQHLKEHQLQSDVKPGDRLFYFTTLGWMMWNWLVSGLASGATLLLYDGSPTVARGRILFDFADAEAMTHLGTSAKFIDSLIKLGLRPRETHKLEKLRALLSTGSPLAPEGFDYVYDDVKRDVCLSSISAAPTSSRASCSAIPIGRCGAARSRPRASAWRRCFRREGQAVRGEKGRARVHEAVPSMPVGFWNDPDGAKYRAAYFEKYPGVWRHGDWCEITAHGGDRHLRPLRRRAQSRRRAHRHRRDLPPGGTAGRGGRVAGDRPGLGGRRARGAVCEAARRHHPG